MFVILLNLIQTTVLCVVFTFQSKNGNNHIFQAYFCNKLPTFMEFLPYLRTKLTLGKIPPAKVDVILISFCYHFYYVLIHWERLGIYFKKWEFTNHNVSKWEEKFPNSKMNVECPPQYVGLNPQLHLGSYIYTRNLFSNN